MHSRNPSFLPAQLAWAATYVLLQLSMLAAPHAAVRAETVDLALVLAVDASGSVNETRFELQKQGYAQAFRHPQVLRAIQSGAHGRIAVTMLQWTGPALQMQVTPWMVIHDTASMSAFAEAIDAAPRRLFSGGTSISGAIDFSARVLADSPHAATRRVIDVSGDGGNNRGRPASAARDEAVAAGIVINGLPILEIDPTLDDHYLRNVIGGPNSFMVPAQSFAEFADAILKKLIIEIAGAAGRTLRMETGPPGAASRREACARC
ncbi:MAG: DUF1194 domain-containing protein [Hyphomicrobiaceae bacterium]